MKLGPPTCSTGRIKALTGHDRQCSIIDRTQDHDADIMISCRFRAGIMVYLLLKNKSECYMRDL